MALLEVAGLMKHFGGVPAVDGCSFAIEAGTVVGLIGPNGCGKSTVIDLVCGRKTPDAGTVTFEGRDVTGVPAYRLARAGLTRTFQRARGWSRLTVLENMLVAAAPDGRESVWRTYLTPGTLRRRDERDLVRARAILEEFGLIGLKDDAAETLSGGQQRLLEFARIVMAQPRMVLLDEPLASVNPVMAERMGAEIGRLARAGITVLLVEHNVAVVEDICPRVIVMAQGRVIAEGSMAELRRRTDVVDAYLGGLPGVA
jgi:ABC-type branched-subunit amino acid transport system ATPase component